MKRVILLALLAMGLPTAALANISFSTGTFSNGTLGGSFTTALDVTIVGNSGSIVLDTGTLSLTPICPPLPICYEFSGGTVSTMPPPSFTDSLNGGLIAKTGNVVSIIAGLVPNSMVLSGQAITSFTYMGGNLTSGRGTVSALTPTPVPELGTLYLFGTGLIGLAGLRRRKLNLGT